MSADERPPYEYHGPAPMPGDRVGWVDADGGPNTPTTRKN